MKASVVLSWCIAPLALAKVVNNVYPGRRNGHQQLSTREKGNQVNVVAGQNSVQANKVEIAKLGISGVGITETSLIQVIILWINPGAGAVTTVINQPATTTVTVQAGGGAAHGTPVVNVGQGTTATGATSVVAGAQATHSVTVGGPAAGLTFQPSEISAKIGDMVIFTFLSNNHTATQSAFDTPCAPLAGGMDSGFQANVNNTVNPPPQVAMQVMVDTPLWFYCKQKGHCGKGMTFSINPTAEKTQAMFQALAISQNGTGTGSGITGNGGGAAGASAQSSAAGATSLTTGVTTATAANGAAATASAGFASGTGQVNADGSCTCAVVCNAGAFPAIAQGAGAFGGFGGAIPATMIGA